jgi:hypothetical protein
LKSIPFSNQLAAITDPTASRQLRELDQALALLPDEQRQTILLIGLEGMSYEEASAILNVPIGTVRSRLSRGRDSLRRLMGMPERSASSGRVAVLARRRKKDPIMTELIGWFAAVVLLSTIGRQVAGPLAAARARGRSDLPHLDRRRIAAAGR